MTRSIINYFKLGSSLGWGLSGSGKKTSFSKKNASTLVCPLGSEKNARIKFWLESNAAATARRVAARRGPAQALANMMTGRAGGRGGRAAPLGAGAAGRGGDIWAQLCRSFAPGRCRTAALSGCYAARPWRPGLQRTLLLHVPRVPACLLPAGYRFALLPAPPELANLQGRAICMAGRIKEHGQHGQDLFTIQLG